MVCYRHIQKLVTTVFKGSKNHVVNVKSSSNSPYFTYAYTVLEYWLMVKGSIIIYGMRGGRQVTEILITLVKHIIYASFLHNILFGL